MHALHAPPRQEGGEARCPDTLPALPASARGPPKPALTFGFFLGGEGNYIPCVPSCSGF